MRKTVSVMSLENFERFRQLVLLDRDLQQQLHSTTGREQFVALTQRLGAERGCDFTIEEVQEALRAAHRAWLERWLQR